MPWQSTANVDMGQQLSLTNCDNLEDFLFWFVVVNRNYYKSRRNYYDNLKHFLVWFVGVKVNSTENYHLKMWIVWLPWQLYGLPWQFLKAKKSPLWRGACNFLRRRITSKSRWVDSPKFRLDMESKKPDSPSIHNILCLSQSLSPISSPRPCGKAWRTLAHASCRF